MPWRGSLNSPAPCQFGNTAQPVPAYWHVDKLPNYGSLPVREGRSWHPVLDRNLYTDIRRRADRFLESN